MGKKTPKAPVAPDPVATAAAQTKMNQQSAISSAYLDRADQVTPEGTLKWSVVGTNPDGTPKFQQTTSYSPEIQAQMDQQNKVASALNNQMLSATDRANTAMAQPWDTSQFQPLQYSANYGNIQNGYDAGGNITRGFDAGGNIQQNYASGGDIARSFDRGGNIQNTYASGGDIQKGLDYSGLDKIPGTGDYGAEAQRVQDAVYNQATSRLDPRMQQEQRQLAATLAAKGVTENSAAYRNAMDQFTRNKTDAYNQATYSGIQAGSQEQSRLFGLALQGRQQGVGEINTQGGFANAAQAQAEAQNAARAGFGNQAQQQQFGQNQALAQFGNDAQAQSETQNAARAMFGNEAQNQQYTQNMGQADFANQAQAQANAQNAAAAAFGNTAQNQGFNQAQANASLNNQTRAQQEASAAYARNLPLQDLASLKGASPDIAGPQFGSTGNYQVAAPDYMGAVQNNYNNQMGQYNQQMASRNSALGSVFGLAGSAMKFLPFSDRRLKHHIKAIGETAGGIKTYVFSYVGSKAREFGVMADEVFKVLPDAVGSRDGYMTVDYGKVWQHA